MKRRGFLMSLTGAAICARAALAQQIGDKPRRVAVLMPFLEEDTDGQSRVAAFLEKMRQLGWTEGRNLRVDVRFPGPDIDRIRIAAKELLGFQPDLIVTHGTAPVVALARETRTIPIVFAAVADPVAGGLVGSFAHPGGNITGFSDSEYSIGGKWLQTIKEIAPNVERAGVLFNPTTAGVYAPRFFHSIEEASSSLAISISTLSVGDAVELEHAMRTLAASQNAALIMLNDVFMRAHREQIIALAAELRLPAIYPYRYFATAGGLMSYGFESLEQFRQAASYVDRILRGAKPGDLPIQLPTKYELVINVKTARALGLTVPLSLLARASEVIE
jgi:putative tryptophan/tyrosine transport system substrate-binding protein